MAETTAAANTGGGGGMAVDPISAGVQAAAAIANTIAGINDMNKRRHFEEAIALLSQRQKAELNEKILKADTATARLQILSSSLVDFAIANENNASKQETTMYIIAGCLAGAIMIGAIIYGVKKK